MDLIDKYLITEKVSRKEAANKVKSAIKSVKTKSQLSAVSKMVASFIKMYDSSFLSDLRDILQDMTPKGAMYKQFWVMMDKKYGEIKA